MPLTKVTSPVLDDDINVSKINGCEISIFAKPNAIPRTNDSGQLDPSWGTGGGGGTGGSGGGGDMYQATYDTNKDGIVNMADKAVKLYTDPRAGQVWGCETNGVQDWIMLDKIFLDYTTYDPNKDGKVVASETADKISGEPGPNKLWGTNDLGKQIWMAMANGDMSRVIYDTNADGTVNAADVAAKIKGNTIANQVWGTDQDGLQTWLDLKISDIMLKTDYDTSGTGNKVSRAVTAEKLASETSAQPGTVYFKNDNGQVTWESLDVISSNAMSVYTYDPDKDGKVTSAEYADKISSATGASYPTIYAKIDTGDAKFVSLSAIEPHLMLKTIYDKDNNGYVDYALKAKSVDGIDNIIQDGNTSYVYGVDYSSYMPGFYKLTDIEPGLILENKYSTLYLTYGGTSDVVIDENAPENFFENYINSGTFYATDTAVQAAYIRTDLMNTPKKGYSYVLTGQKFNITTQQGGDTSSPTISGGMYETAKDFEFATYYWAGWNGLHGAKLTLASNISIPQSTETTINWTKALHNSEDLWNSANPSKLIFPEEESVSNIVDEETNPDDITPNQKRAPMEWCRICFNIKFLESETSAGMRRVIVKKNDTAIAELPYVKKDKESDTETNCWGITGPISTTYGDVFTLTVYHDNTSSLSIDASSYISLELI